MTISALTLKAIRRALALADVPLDMRPQALACLQEAARRARGLTAHQWRARLAAKRIAKALPWEAETVGECLPELARYGVAPNYGSGVNGDNVPWAEWYLMPDGSTRQLWMLGSPRGGWQGRQPDLQQQADADVNARRAAILREGGKWQRNAPCTLPLERDTNPESLDYRCAVARNYWGHRFFSGGAGLHPRSVQARTAWLRSNGGEFEAWARGQPVPESAPVREWHGQAGRWRARVLRQADAWQINLQFRLFGRWQLGWRLGYEIDNARHAHPRPGFDRRACLTWSLRPDRLKKENAP